MCLCVFLWQLGFIFIFLFVVVVVVIVVVVVLLCSPHSNPCQPTPAIPLAEIPLWQLPCTLLNISTPTMGWYVHLHRLVGFIVWESVSFLVLFMLLCIIIYERVPRDFRDSPLPRTCLFSRLDLPFLCFCPLVPPPHTGLPSGLHRIS